MTQDDEHLIAELLPCPFCGGLNLEDNLNSVNCETCGARILVAWSPGEDSDPVGAWNTRTEPPSPLSDRVERLEQALRPFADAPHQVLHWNKETEQHDVVTPPDDEMASIFNVTWGDIRRARAALGDSEP